MGSDPSAPRERRAPSAMAGQLPTVGAVVDQLHERLAASGRHWDESPDELVARPVKDGTGMNDVAEGQHLRATTPGKSH